MFTESRSLTGSCGSKLTSGSRRDLSGFEHVERMVAAQEKKYRSATTISRGHHPSQTQTVTEPPAKRVRHCRHCQSTAHDIRSDIAPSDFHNEERGEGYAEGDVGGVGGSELQPDGDNEDHMEDDWDHEEFDPWGGLDNLDCHSKSSAYGLV
ncbi:hypothetical protein PsorP6_009354 [Peronosclerospora sorghi]|uniref:Uncharacterized protein n=1 Tax=Peronosclerospora sorghi TaxID=230839 RepID=A0ACC0VYW0_9STRA|nr:hypothetical protein PsorP6_009354 [Peronosclerospora sorghi]